MPALIVVDHGSKHADANEMLDDVVALMRSTPGFNFDPILAAHMELAQPSLRDAIAQLAQDNIRDVIVFPYFLSPGKHSTEDIPRLAKDAAMEHPGMRIRVTACFGVNPKLVDAALLRIRQATDDPKAAKPKESQTTTRIRPL